MSKKNNGKIVVIWLFFQFLTSWRFENIISDNDVEECFILMFWLNVSFSKNHYSMFFERLIFKLSKNLMFLAMFF